MKTWHNIIKRHDIRMTDGTEFQTYRVTKEERKYSTSLLTSDRSNNKRKLRTVWAVCMLIQVTTHNSKSRAVRSEPILRYPSGISLSLRDCKLNPLCRHLCWKARMCDQHTCMLYQSCAHCLYTINHNQTCLPYQISALPQAAAKRASRNTWSTWRFEDPVRTAQKTHCISV